MVNTQFGFFKNVYYVEDFDKQLTENGKIDNFTLENDEHEEWEDLRISLRIIDGQNSNIVESTDNEVIYNEEKKSLSFLDIADYGLVFEDQEILSIDMEREGDNFAYGIFYCEVILDGFKRYFYKSGIAKSFFTEDGSGNTGIQEIANNCFNFGYDLPKNSCNPFLRKVYDANLFAKSYKTSDLGLEFTDNNGTITINVLNQVFFTIELTSVFNRRIIL